VFWVGLIQERKNVVRLVRAFAGAAREIRGLELVLAGGRGYRADDVVREVTRAGVEGSVRFTGRLPDHEIVAGMTGAAVFAFPSLYEGFGLPVLEAFACGAPVVSSDVSSLPDVVGEAGVLVPPEDVDALRHALVRVAGNAAYGRELAARGRARLAQFTWVRTAAETLRFFELPPTP
jgi:glycosyltransferase involved in cell wall biosynthesis